MILRELLVHELDLTQEEIDQHIPDILDILLKDKPTSVSRTRVPESLNHLFQKSHIDELIRKYYIGKL